MSFPCTLDAIEQTVPAKNNRFRFPPTGRRTVYDPVAYEFRFDGFERASASRSRRSRTRGPSDIEYTVHRPTSRADVSDSSDSTRSPVIFAFSTTTIDTPFVG